jgi:hypothetical protein
MDYRFRRASLQVTLKAGDVGARTEGAPGPGNHNDTNHRIELNVVEFLHDGSEQVVAEGVQFGRAVQGQKRNRAPILTLQDRRSLSVL